MGVDFWFLKHSDVYMSYTTFHQIRKTLAQGIGMNLDEMKGYGGSGKWEDWNDDLIPLLNHSDCEGQLTWKECQRIYPRLREIANRVHWENEGDKELALNLADVMEECAKKKMYLEFR